MSIQDEIRQRLTSRKQNGWKRLVLQYGADVVKKELIELIAQSLRSGKDPQKARLALDEVLFKGCSIGDLDVLIRLKE